MHPIRAWRHTKSLSVIRRGKAEGLITRSPARKTKGQRKREKDREGRKKEDPSLIRQTEPICRLVGQPFDKVHEPLDVASHVRQKQRGQRTDE